MKPTVIIALCIICMIMSSAMFAAGYSSWTDYKNANTAEQIGQDVITAIDGTTAKIANTADKVAQLIEDPLQGIANMFRDIVDEIKEFFGNAFKKLIPGYNPSEDSGSGTGGDGTGGDGFGGGGDGMGGGGGGAR